MNAPVSQDKHVIAQQMLDAIYALQPLLRDNADQARAERKVPQANIDALQEAGFFLALQPKAWGGYELDPQDFFRMQMAIAEACMSTAWASGIVAVHAFQLALMDERAQQDVWGDDIHTRVSSSYAPLGKVEPVEGGFRFSGRWGWSSGSEHCTWVLLGGVCPDGGYRSFLIPRADYEIVDTWQSMGLQGTGSQDIVVNDVFVPDYRTHKAEDGYLGTNPGITADSAPLYHLPWAQLFIRVVSTPAIGASKAALSLYQGLVLGKASGDVTKLAGDTGTQERIAEAANAIDEMETIMYRNFDQMTLQVNAGDPVPVQDRIKYRYQASLVIEKSMAVVDSLFSSAGGSSVFLGSDIQQRFLDIHTARAHVANNPVSFARNLGATLLGVENADFFV
ncbi:acyl-CoA dehydrogenase family protein [Halioglobus pacificus]|uniref:Acyl-CoA dehydrogenase n=1 Tax=Parahalioglobus pacificus TaxID=930806 RepID=A0A919CJX1_9GAMM|nr:acyl-CoA dehydrogenase family protein [Halioglobus pacificus]NQY03262.1 flavin-dependent monooxygenase [Halieaceae bacterium]GHD30980.1 acyl-CoA dehydrogenase [Halioglobus pacificus]